MDTFHAHHADILDPAQQPRVIALLREYGLVTFTGITDRTTLASAARTLLSIRPHRDAGPELAMFSAETASIIPLLCDVITEHLHTIELLIGQGLLVSNTRWLHGRDRYSGPRAMLRMLGDPLPGTGIQPGFPAPAPGTETARAA